MWDGLSGVPGLGNHIRNAHNSENIYKEWSEEMSPKLKHQSISPRCSEKLNTHLVLPQHGCSNRFYDSYTSTCDSSSSTNSCDEKSWHEIRSLHHLPSFSNRFSRTTQENPNSHRKLQRTGVSETKAKHPKVTFSGLSDILPVDEGKHQKLSRKKDIKSQKEKCQVLCTDCKETENKVLIDEIFNEKSDTQIIKDDDYSYAHR